MHINRERMILKAKQMLNTERVLTILVMVFKISGFATFSIQKSGSSRQFVNSKFGSAYNVLLVSLMIAGNFFAIPYRINAVYQYKTNLTVGIEILLTILGTFAVCFIFLAYSLKQNFLMTTCNRFLNVERELGNLKDAANHQCGCYFSCIITFHIVYCVVLVLMDYITFNLSPISWFTDLIPAFFIETFVLQYFVAVAILKMAFLRVNSAILDFRHVGNTYDLVEHRSHSNNPRLFANGTTVLRIRQLRDLHARLCEISEDLANFCSLPVLFGITFIFITLVYNGYYFVTPFMVYNEELDIILIADVFLWIILLTYPLVLLSNGIDKILREIGKTGFLVHRLLYRSYNRECKVELKQFSLELLHRNVQFTACGLFKLDSTLLHSIASAVTTYLVILVQFQMAGSDGRGAANNST